MVPKEGVAESSFGKDQGLLHRGVALLPPLYPFFYCATVLMTLQPLLLQSSDRNHASLSNSASDRVQPGHSKRALCVLRAAKVGSADTGITLAMQRRDGAAVHVGRKQPLYTCQ